MLNLTALSIGYRDKVIAADITAHLPKGRLTCLIGPNGAGKSTLMRTIAAFQPPLGGTMTIAQSAIHSLTPQARAKLIGVVLTDKPDIQNMSVHEMVAMGRSPYTGFFGRLSSSDHAIISEAITLVGMTAFDDRDINSLSDGERQKVMIAKALAQQTPLIILDEPTAFLDYPSKVETIHMLRRLCHEQGKTVLLSTHDLDVALALTDHVWLMQNHQLLTGTTSTLSSEISTFMKK